MSAETLDDAGAATIEVRIFRDDQLLARELRESEEERDPIASAPVPGYGTE